MCKVNGLSWRGLALTCCALWLVMSTTMVHASTVDFSFDFSSTNLQVGDTLTADIIGTYDDIDYILGGALDFFFNSSIFEVTDVTLLVPNLFDAPPGIIDNSAGVVEKIGFADFGGVTGTFTFASIDLLAIGAGTGLFHVEDSEDLIFKKGVATS